MASQKELEKRAAALLMDEGYECAQCSTIGGFFDIAARREGMLLVKVLEDINAFAAAQAMGMRNAGAMLESGCFVLGELAGGKMLKDGVLYRRHEVDAGGPGTFEMLVGKQEIFVRKNRREYARLDGKRLARERERTGFALRELAKKSGISKDTLCRYENGSKMAVGHHAEILEDIMGVRLRENVARGQIGDAMLFDFYGLAAARLAKPFELVAREKNGEGKVVFGSAHDKRTLQRRAALCEVFSQISRADCCFMVEKSKRDDIFGVPVIRREEFGGMQAGQIVKLVRERRGLL